MGDPDRSRWTLLLLRDDGVRVGRWRFGPAAGIAAALAGLTAAVAAGVGAGLWWAGRAESDRVRALASEVRELRADRRRVGRLADRLDSIEGAYRRLRRALDGGDGPAGDRAVGLPPVAGAGAADARPRDGEDRWRWPLAREGFVTRAFDASGATGHPGLDVAVPTGSYVRAARPGVVVEAGTDSVYGRYLRLEHRSGARSLYGHAGWLFVGPGDTVEGGEVVALSGNTGRSSAPHLHFEVRQEGEAVDPARLLRGEVGGSGTPDREERGGSP